jgi:transposase InsO family protein
VAPRNESLIKQSFRYLAKRARLGHYWRRFWKRFRHGARKLSDSQVTWIVRARAHGTSCKDIARTLENAVSVRRIEQVYSEYRETGHVPSFGKPGRPKVDIPSEERKAIGYARSRFKVGACHLVPVLRRYYGIQTNHMRVYRVLREEGLLYSRARRGIRRSWIRWEREFSNELWHIDWHLIKDPRWRGMWLIVYEDDASRRIMSHGLFEHATSPHSVEVLKGAIAEFGKPGSILSDRGSTFYAVESEARKKGLTEFELYLMSNHIEQVLAGKRHPETNGKLEKLFDILETGLARGIPSIDDCVYWYNCERPHGALDLKRAETPMEAYYRKLPQKDVLVDPSIVINQGQRSEMIS